ncbi:hypothetical protein KR038_012092 [Drosophila bunnanda]|nr:hypothetical protein KR038_012092 [Drosophila bunnanda]
MNYSAISHTLVGITFCLLLFFLDIAQARPWWNTADYDPSLDPVAWSRSFVQDQVRKTRYNVLPDVIKPRSKHRHRQTASQMWYEQSQPAPAGKYYKRFSRRRQKLASREKYSRWRP